MNTNAPHKRLIIKIISSLLLLLNCHQPLLAQGTQAHADLLLGIIKFTDWSGFEMSSEAPIRIGVWGDAGFADILSSTVRGQQVYHRAMEVVAVDALEQTRGLQVLFFGSLQQAQVDHWLAERQSSRVLTVANARADFCQDGGLVNIFVSQGAPAFQINYSRCVSLGVKISPQVLTKAVIVNSE